jgi:hypothetical protein
MQHRVEKQNERSNAKLSLEQQSMMRLTHKWSSMVLKALHCVRFHVDEHAQVPGHSEDQKPKDHMARCTHAFRFIKANLFVHMAECIAKYKDNAQIVSQVVGIVGAIFIMQLFSGEVYEGPPIPDWAWRPREDRLDWRVDTRTRAHASGWVAILVDAVKRHGDDRSIVRNTLSTLNSLMGHSGRSDWDGYVVTGEQDTVLYDSIADYMTKIK